jgi:hypothetical protein
VTTQVLQVMSQALQESRPCSKKAGRQSQDPEAVATLFAPESQARQPEGEVVEQVMQLKWQSVQTLAAETRPVKQTQVLPDRKEFTLQLVQVVARVVQVRQPTEQLVHPLRVAVASK